MSEMSDKHSTVDINRLTTGDLGDFEEFAGLEGTLTLKQSRFVDAYIATGNGAEAARKAGYPEAI
jgi:hypothetical protein